ncbi:MAG: TspO/MBR family protein [Minisyncoccia bacterium]
MESDTRLANAFIFYSATLLFFAVGAITTLGLPWYRALLLPAWAPSEFTVAVIWCVLFLLAALSASAIWNHGTSRALSVLYAGNALLVLLWNYLFFGPHALGLALLVAIILALSLVVLIILAGRVSRRAAWLLAPYLAWLLFALALTHAIYRLNA